MIKEQEVRGDTKLEASDTGAYPTLKSGPKRRKAEVHERELTRPARYCRVIYGVVVQQQIKCPGSASCRTCSTCRLLPRHRGHGMSRPGRGLGAGVKGVVSGAGHGLGAGRGGRLVPTSRKCRAWRRRPSGAAHIFRAGRGGGGSHVYIKRRGRHFSLP